MRRIPSVRVGIIVAICFIIAAYASYEARNVVRGPMLSVETPVSGMTTEETSVSLRGTAKNIVSITLNDRPITTDEHGLFAEDVSLPPGHSIVKVAAQDKFGRSKNILIEIIRKEAQEGLVRK